MLHGDIYGMQERVKEEYPDHEIVYQGEGRYGVIEKRRKLRQEGVLDGRPLFSMAEVRDLVFTFNHIPDMRVLDKLRDADIYRHPKGPMGWFDEKEAQAEARKQEIEQKRRDEIADVARDAHKHIFNELDGMAKSTFSV